VYNKRVIKVTLFFGDLKMKVTNLTKKPFLIPAGKGPKIMLAPASGVVELPSGADERYITALEKSGKVKIEKAARKYKSRK
jgi:hypothetical protein